MNYKLFISSNLISSFNLYQQALLLVFPIFYLVLWFKFWLKSCNYSNFYLKDHFMEFLNEFMGLMNLNMAQ